MKDLKFEQKRSLTRTEAADQLEALAEALRAGEEAEVPLGGGVLSLRIPEELRSEVEFEVDDGEIELEIELKWRTDRGSRDTAAPEGKADGAEAPEPEPGPKTRPGTKGAEAKKTEAGKKAEAGSASPAPAARRRKATSPAKPRRTAAKAA
ncbi:amphi-Trp domain-containing protein [Streptomyces sp. NRRL B-24572]|uniref:amphi-Trp domain-containing protein n=1 Tax=Streptomyces sp. NRRL B-24572 TaxID=1962156 RepID=UPI000A3AD6F8|nr:amphi-Trp domain-containing protein [Streptomyces sp. NRRL B-24572]